MGIFVTRVLLVVALVACLTTVARAIAGQATYYTPPYLPSACFGFQGRGVMIAAANRGLYANGAACGRRYRVTCTGGTNQGIPNPCRGSVVVTIVDLCPGCNGNQIDLSQEAFSAIANPDAGRIHIDYTQLGLAAEEDHQGVWDAIRDIPTKIALYYNN